MSIALRHMPLVTVEEYLAGEELSPIKHEYLNGVVHAMAGAVNRHNWIAVNITSALFARLKGKRCRPFNSDTKVRIAQGNDRRFYYPDVQIVCRFNSMDEHFQDHPAVIFEVRSESTARIDSGEKRDAYLTIPSLKVLLFVEPDSPTVTLYRRLPEGGFASERHGGLDAIIELAEIGAHLSLADLYDRVEFAL